MRTPDAPHDKSAWRASARAARARLDTAAWSAACVAAVRAWAPYRHASTIATYLAFGDEADLSALLGDGPRFCVPRVGAPGTVLTLHPMGVPLERHAFGMTQPAAGAVAVDPREVDVALVPGLAFDRAGGRIGHGAGHYDRLLPFLRPEVPRVGVAHPDLVAADLPLEPHDVRLTHLALPAGVVSTERV